MSDQRVVTVDATVLEAVLAIFNPAPALIAMGLPVQRFHVNRAIEGEEITAIVALAAALNGKQDAASPAAAEGMYTKKQVHDAFYGAMHDGSMVIKALDNFGIDTTDIWPGIERRLSAPTNTNTGVPKEENS